MNWRADATLTSHSKQLETMRKKPKKHLLSALFMATAAFVITACAEEEAAPDGSKTAARVRFHVEDAQATALRHNMRGITRGSIVPGMTTSGMIPQRLEAHDNHGLDVCLIDETIEGINPVEQLSGTRATVKTSIDADFTASGIRAASASGIATAPQWFSGERTKPVGELYHDIPWSLILPDARFYAVYPEAGSYSGIQLSAANANGRTCVDFEVMPDVKKQVDLMTACTGDVHYATPGVPPETNLRFRHALTAVRFAVGQNLSWDKTIDRIELRNVLSKARYILSDQYGGNGAAWDYTVSTARTNCVLQNVSVSTGKSPNTIIAGTDTDNYTFYMIPQQLTGKGVMALIHCTDGTLITTTLKGQWEAGTTRTYKLTQRNSTWQYTLLGTSAAPAEYNQSTTNAFTITSYRTAPNGYRQTVPWKVVAYSTDDGATWTAQKPAWLISLSRETGDGGDVAQTGTATLRTDIVDLLAQRNNTLRQAQQRGSAATPFDLSTQGDTRPRTTANSYLITAPGFYRIPLVYGNAIENGATNEKSYKSSKTSPNILQTFLDHDGKPITDPWIEQSNGGANAGIDGAHIVWSDENGLVHLGPSPIVHDGGKAYLQFEVKANDIKNGNAVVAVTRGGTTVWTWHLWFAPQQVLDKIEVTNYQNVKYNFTTENLGWKYTTWNGSAYDTDRKVKVRIEQTISQNGTPQYTVIDIVQRAGQTKRGYGTLYQWGRKDAFPATETLPEGAVIKDTGNHMTLKNGMQNPGTFYVPVQSWMYNYTYFNLWDADNTDVSSSRSNNDGPTIKTVYDPSPAGFKVPATNAFTGFTTTGGNVESLNQINTSQTYNGSVFQRNMGYVLWTNGNHNKTIYLPAAGRRDQITGDVTGLADYGQYTVASPTTVGSSGLMIFNHVSFKPLLDTWRCTGSAVRPVAE